MMNRDDLEQVLFLLDITADEHYLKIIHKRVAEKLGIAPPPPPIWVSPWSILADVLQLVVGGWALLVGLVGFGANWLFILVGLLLLRPGLKYLKNFSFK